MELRQLRYFAAVARLGTYAAAAESLHVAQPALWQQVRSLESELATPLFERVGRRVRLSRHGAALLDRVEQLLAAADVVVRQSRSVASGRSGLVVIACASPHVARFLAPVIGRFRVDHPGIAIELREHPPLAGWPIDELTPGTADLALAARSSEFDGFPVYSARVVMPVSPAHRWFGRKKIDVRDLEGEPLLASTHPGLSRSLLERACEAAGFQPQIVMESASPSTLMALGAAGAGVPVLADDAAATVASGAYPLLVDDDGELGAEVWLQWRPQVTMTPALELFIAAARAAADATSPRGRSTSRRRSQPSARGRSSRRPGRAQKGPRSTAARPAGRR